MSTTFNRRTLLRSGALLAGGLPLLPSWVAAAVNHREYSFPRLSSLEQEAAMALHEDPEVPVKARLFANENPFGPSPGARKAVIDAIAKSYQYPFFEIAKLQKMIADKEGVLPEQILISCGSTPLLQAAAVLYAKNGGTIATADLTYDDLPETAESFGGKLLRVPLNAKFQYDLPALEKKATGASLVYICNPNNPTATSVDAAELKSFCERVSPKTPVFVDEAYIDYLGNPDEATVIPLVKKGLPVIVARTFSKLYGLAGMRIGYVISSADIIKELSHYCIGTFGLSATSVAAAAASYNDTAYKKEAISKTFASRDFLYAVLKEEGYSWIPSSANFVLFPVKMDSQRFASELMKRGVGVRSWQYNGTQYCRISIGTMDEMKEFEKAFKEIS